MPELYPELKRLAASKIAHEAPGRTLMPTALLHEAYLCLENASTSRWNGPGHFFGAIAEAMRRILIEQARLRSTAKRGGGFHRVPMEDVENLTHLSAEDLLALDEAICSLETRGPRIAEIVKLRFFGGRTIPEVAALLDVSEATVSREWSFARTWLYRELGGIGEGEG